MALQKQLSFKEVIRCGKETTRLFNAYTMHPYGTVLLSFHRQVAIASSCPFYSISYDLVNTDKFGHKVITVETASVASHAPRTHHVRTQSIMQML